MRDPVPRAVELYFHCTLFAVHVTHCVPYMVFVYKVFSLNEVPLTGHVFSLPRPPSCVRRPRRA